MAVFRYKYERFIPPQNSTGFADKREFVDMLFPLRDNGKQVKKAGIPLVRGEKMTYTDSGEDHYIILGNTSSKKSRNVGMPTIEFLAEAGESMIIADPKGEYTRRHRAGLEKKGYKTAVLDFKNMLSDSWNPLAYIYELHKLGQEDKALTYIADLVETLSAPSKEKSKDVFWNLMAESLLQGYLDLMLNICKKEEYNISTLMDFISEKNSIYVDKILECVPTYASAYYNIKNVKLAPEKTYACIINTLHGILKMFILNKSLCSMLKCNSFNISEIDSVPTAVFLVIPDNKDTMNGLVSLFVSQLSNILIDKADINVTGRLKRRVNWIIDEFGNITEIPGLANMITAARSRNMRYFLFVQSLDQIKNKYNAYQTIAANCSKVFLHSNELETLEYISELCGNKIIAGCEYPLISPAELQQLSKEKGEALVLKNRCKPYLTMLTDIDDYPQFKFDFADIPIKDRMKFKISDIVEILEEILIGQRECYDYRINDIKI